MDFGQVLSTTPPIVESIFKSLSWRDLEQCSQVCELWKQLAETERNRRKDIFCFFRGCRLDVHSMGYGRISLEYLVLFGKPVSSNEDSQELGVIGARNEVIKQLKDLKSVPYFCLIFATADFVHSFDYLFPQSELLRNAKRRKRHLWNISEEGLHTGMETVFRKYLPEHCRLTSCIANGIVGRRDESSPFEISSGSAISGVILPHIPGVKIYSFGLKCEILKVIPQDINIKCLLMFGNINFVHVDREIHNCLQREKSKIAIGGTSVMGLELEEATFIAFCGENVEAASIVVNEKDDEKAVEEKLKLFKSTGLLNNKCFAVIFSQTKYRFETNDQKENLASVFHKLYPKISVTGVCGDVQVGVDYLPNVPAKRKSIFRDRLPVLHKPTRHFHTTVFVLISIKV